MVIICVGMDNICAILEKALQWAGRIDSVPVVFARPCRSRMLTDARPLLEFYLHVSGDDAEVTVGGRRQCVRPGDLIVMNAHLGNRGHCMGTWCYWCVSFRIDECSVFDFLADGPFLLKTRVRRMPAVKQAFSRVVREYGREDPLHRFRMKSAVLSFLAALWENVTPGATGFHAHSSAVAKCLEKIHVDYPDRNLRLDELAAAAHLSVDHFGRLFRRELGVSPVKYLTQYRIARARELLQRGDLSVKEIASEVGFRDPLHFSRVFAALTGCSPSRFKQDA